MMSRSSAWMANACVWLRNDAGLVVYRREGRNRVYRLNAAPLREVYDWLGHYERFWREKLSALGDYLEETSDE
jgi:hypothetical protein